ncbi:hypothetical protein ACQCVP_06010 [Rossellomorea vietnamensis]|uniref:hypothetical protein n=1 Tax=Rossellomorea vietnamensis TaxID=218284 RepID=UPI003CEE4821
MSKPGKMNLEQTSEQLAKQQGKNDVEFSTDDFQAGNSQSQSQKKSGRQKNKK